MATTLTGTNPQSTYDSLLHTDGQIDVTLKTVYDGAGNSTGLQISTTGIATPNISSTNTGTKIGTATTQKFGFWNAAPVVQQSGSIIDALQTTGLVNAPTIDASDVSGLAAATQQVYAQESEPLVVGPAIWIQTGLGNGNDITLWAIY